MTVRPVATLAAALLAAVPGLAGCGSPSEKKLNDRVAGTPAASTGPVRLEMKDNKFVPTTFTGQTGSTLVIQIKNSGKLAHTFTSPDLEVDRTVPSGDTETVTATARREGEFRFVCSFHEAQGMAGTIVVRG